MHTGESFDLSAITSDGTSVTGGVTGGVTDGVTGGGVGVVNEVLLDDFVEAAVRRDEPRLAAAREALEIAMGPDALVDAAAVIGCFQRLNRIADGTGIALDERMVMMTAGLRDELNVDDDYVSAENTPKLSGLKRLLANLMRPLEGFMMRAMQKGVQKAQARKTN